MKIVRRQTLVVRGTLVTTLLAPLLVSLGACVGTGDDKDGSQTHFTGKGDAGTRSLPPDDSAAERDTEDEPAATSEGAEPAEVNDDSSGEGSELEPGSDVQATDETSAGEAADTSGAEPTASDTEPELTETDCTSEACEPTSEPAEGYEPCAGKLCGDPCTVCAPGDPNCAEDPSLKTCGATGECDAVTVDCEPTRPLCEATEFQSSDDGCVEESFVWDGERCVAVQHCGCVAGNCDRLHADEARCAEAHSACIPAACVEQDAAPTGLMCGDLLGYAFRGWECREVFCQCQGEDCDDLEPTQEACQSRFAACFERTPACVDAVFPVAASDPGYEPTYPAFGFSVEGYSELFDTQTEAPLVFADWTDAAWVGWEEVPEAEFCVPIPPARFLTNCPAPRVLVLSVGEQTVRISVTLHWDEAVLATRQNTDVQVRISAHASGTALLEIREAETALPVVVVASDRSASAGLDEPWDLGAFVLSAGAVRCNTEPDSCNWTYSALGLQLTTPDEERWVDPLSTIRVSVGNADYAVLHGYLFRPSASTADACPLDPAWHQNFAVLQVAPELQ